MTKIRRNDNCDLPETILQEPPEETGIDCVQKTQKSQIDTSFPDVRIRA
jgi:hypothetical protein